MTWSAGQISSISAISTEHLYNVVKPIEKKGFNISMAVAKCLWGRGGCVYSFLKNTYSSRRFFSLSQSCSFSLRICYTFFEKIFYCLFAWLAMNLPSLYGFVNFFFISFCNISLFTISFISDFVEIIIWSSHIVWVPRLIDMAAMSDQSIKRTRKTTVKVSNTLYLSVSSVLLSDTQVTRKQV